MALNNTKDENKVSSNAILLLWYTYPRFGFERYSIYSTRDGKHKKASNITLSLKPQKC